MQDPDFSSPSFTPLEQARRARLRRVMGTLLVLAMVIGFFVGRRIYYRMIQPPPLWTVATPTTEKIACPDSLTVSLWADEKLIHNPTSLSVDTRGRVWACEGVNYRESVNRHRDTGQAFQPEGDQVVILEDTDGDGLADLRKVFVQDQDLQTPTGLCVVGQRVYVACSPSLFVFIDDNGDDRADRKEVLLTGFGGQDHDHGLHGLTIGPEGRLYFTVGNAGPHIVTDKSGWTLRAGSLHQSPPTSQMKEAAPVALNTGGLRSDDDHVYVGSLILSVNPDGTQLRVHSHNARNPYGTCVDSFGNLWQTDNDDAQSCRMSWVMPGGSMGFTSADGHRAWPDDQRPGQSTQVAHWHQDDPGVVPAGLIYGTGAPTGLIRYEGTALGSEFQGAILACDAGLGAVYAFQPQSTGAGFQFQQTRFLWAEQGSAASDRPDGLALTWFRPTDLAIGPVGELYVADWYDSYVGAHRVNDSSAVGRIYVVRPKLASTSAVKDAPSPVEKQRVVSPPVTPPTGLASDSASQRWEVIENHAKRVPPETASLTPLLQSGQPCLRARALWLLAQSGDEGRSAVRSHLKDVDSEVRVAAMRALVSSGVPITELAPDLVNDASPAVRRELAVALRGVPLEQARPWILALASELDAKDRYAIEAFGLACEGHEDAIYAELKQQQGTDPLKWSPVFSRIAWRLHPPTALDDLVQRLQVDSASGEEVLWTIDSIAFCGSDRSREVIQQYMSRLVGAPTSEARRDAGLIEYCQWWVTRLNQLAEQSDQAPISLNDFRLNVKSQPPVKQPVDAESLQRISKFPGDRHNGETLFLSTTAACSQCHRVAGKGGEVGPDLTGIAARLNRSQIAEAILYPSNSIRTGYDSWGIVDKQGKVTTGLLVSVGNDFVLRTAEGKRKAIPHAEIDELVRQGVSLMPDALSKHLREQDVADIVEFLSQPATVVPQRQGAGPGESR